MPGIDFHENYLLVVNDITFHILLLIVIHVGYLAKIVKMEMVFSMGNFKKKFTWSVPKVCLGLEKLTASF